MLDTVFGFPVFQTLAAVLLSVLPVSVKDNAGEVIEGDLEGFTASAVLVNQSGKVTELPFQDVLSLRPEDVEEKTPPPYRVMLVGGSKIAAYSVSLTDNDLVIEPKRQNELKIPIKEARAIRFRPPSIATDAKWLGILDRESRGDKLVIRRPEDRLDPQQGVVVSIGAEKVGFDFDGDVIDAPIDRLEGIVFGGSRAIVEDADIRVTDVFGSQWAVAAIEPSRGDQPLQIRLSASSVHEIPLHQIQSIRFSGGFTMLADEDPASDSFQPYVQTNVDNKLMRDFFGPRPNGDADLLMTGGSSIEFRIEPGYQLFAGSVRRHEQVTRAGSVTVQIALDGKTVWEQQLQDAEARGFELPLELSRRLKITVESEQDGDLGDTVRISRPRLLK